MERDGGFWVVKKRENDCHKDAIHFTPIPKDAMTTCGVEDVVLWSECKKEVGGEIKR